MALEGIIIIILVNFGIYWRTLRYGFVSDDIEPSKRKKDNNKYWLKEQDIKTEPHTVKNWWHRMWLQTTGAVYFKKQEGHFITMLLHTINCLLIFLVFGKNYTTLIAALLFSINPVNTQGGSIWLSGKLYSISTMLGLLMFSCPLLAPGFFFLTKFFSINAIAIPLVFLATPYWYLAFMTPLGVYMYRKILKQKRKVGTNFAMRKIAPHKIIPYLKSFGYYFFLCLAPWRIALYHSFLWGLGVHKVYDSHHYKLNKDFWYGLFCFLGVTYGIVATWGSLTSFGLLWFIINITMWCNIVTYQQQISERCCYTANIGTMLFLASIIHTYPLAIAVVFTYYLTRLFHIMPMYENEYWHTHYSVAGSPKCNYIWVARGQKKFRVQNYLGAFLDYMEGKNCTPWEFKANFNAANMAVILQKFKLAEALLDDAEKCMYRGHEEDMTKRIKATRDWIKESLETKNINLAKVQTVK